MAKRKATFTKGTAAQNRAMLRRAKELLADADLDMVANDHQEIANQMKVEFPGILNYRIFARMAAALRQLRYEKKNIIE